MSRARSPSIAKPKSNPNTATKQRSNQANTSNQPHEYSWYSRDAQYANELRYLVSLSKIVTKRNELKLNRAKPEVNCSHRVNTTKRHTAAVTNMAEWPSKSKARANWERHLVTNRHIYDVVKNVFLNAHTHTHGIFTVCNELWIRLETFPWMSFEARDDMFRCCCSMAAFSVIYICTHSINANCWAFGAICYMSSFPPPMYLVFVLSARWSRPQLQLNGQQ